MTINIAVVTSEALVLGCDSIASSTEYLVNPFTCESEDSDEGYLRVKVTPADIVQQVTNTWDGVTKMFPLHAGSLPVAGVTAGLAKLNNRTMSSYANEFFTLHGGQSPIELTPTFSATIGTYLSPQTVEGALTTVEEVAHKFLSFMRAHYETHYTDSKIPEEYRDGPVFLVGGYSRNQHLPSLYRVNVQANRATLDYDTGAFGISWEGQSDAVERLLRGYDTHLRARIENEIRTSLDRAREVYGEATARILQEVLDKLGQKPPDGFSMELPPAPKVTLPWNRFATPISYGDLPLQDAVNLAAYLVGLQSGKARFAHGVPTVGGRTHVGVITKANGFRMLDEPELRHTNVGFI